MNSAVDTARFYDRIQPLYPVIDLFLRAQRRRLLAAVNSHPAGNLLEIGIGSGAHLRLYGSQFRITGIDLSAGMLRKAAARSGDGTRLLQMDGQEMDFPGDSFDYVVLSHVIAVVDDPARLLQEVYRVLKPGGSCFILNHFTPENGLGYVDRLFQPVGKLLHFRSRFTTDDLPGLDRFELLSNRSTGPFGYYRQLTLRKP